MRKIYFILFCLMSLLLMACTDTTDPNSGGSSVNNGGSGVKTPIVRSGQLDDCVTVSYTLSDSRDSFKVTVDHSDGLIVSLNGSSLGRVTSEATFTRSLSTGDIVKLENDGTFCLGTAINYSITFN